MEKSMEKGLKANLTSAATWKRGLYMLLFAVIYSLAEIVLVGIVLFQFGTRLITGQPNRRLLDFGQQLATYIYQIVLFQAFKTEEMPYPFEVWPKGAPKATATGGAKRQTPRKRKEPETTTES